MPVRYCPYCRKPVRPRIPGVLPKTRLCNSVLARTASEHYLDVSKGTLLHEMHRFAALAMPAYEKLKCLFRQAEVKYADETPWRTDGNNGYAWLFIGGPIRLFVCEETRAMSVPAEVLADSTGALMTDRYAGYNCFAGNWIYCLEHLKRDTLEIVQENPRSRECIAFANHLAPLLAEAMTLRTACSGNPVTYFVQAVEVAAASRR